MKTKKPTITDIAEMANVSITAVSFALNKKPGVGEETARRIIKIAREMNYPITKSDVNNSVVQIVKLTKHGHILNDRHNVFISGYIDGITRQCLLSNMKIEITSSSYEDMNILVKNLEKSEGIAPISGAIVLATELDEEDIKKFQNVRRPLCFIDANFKFLPLSFVDIDNISTVGKIIAYLKNMGHEKIGMVSSSYPSPNFVEREEAYQLSLAMLGLTYDKRFMYRVDPTIEKSYIDMSEQLKGKEKFPTAFFCVNDIVAYGVMRALQETGKQIPDDISIVGFDDLPSSQVCNPTLTTVSIPTKLIGIRAVQLLSQQMEQGVNAINERISIGGNLVERNTVLKLNIS